MLQSDWAEGFLGSVLFLKIEQCFLNYSCKLLAGGELNLVSFNWLFFFFFFFGCVGSSLLHAGFL